MFTVISLSRFHGTRQLPVYTEFTRTVNHLKVPICVLKFGRLPNWHKLQKFLTSF